MNKGFNLVLNRDFQSNVVQIDNVAANTSFEATLSKLLDKDVIDGNELQNTLFNIKDVDVFISYSHKDTDVAKRLASLLKDKCKLEVFLDCEAWACADDCLRNLDKHFCLQDDGNYSYEKRNKTTSHVHVMLSLAIFKQIEHSRFIFFLNTSSSVPTVKDTMTNLVESPWIYEEIVFADSLIKKKLYESFVEDSLRVKYKVPLSNFINLSANDISRMTVTFNTRDEAIDYLDNK